MAGDDLRLASSAGLPARAGDGSAVPAATPDEGDDRSFYGSASQVSPRSSIPQLSGNRGLHVVLPMFSCMCLQSSSEGRSTSCCSSSSSEYADDTGEPVKQASQRGASKPAGRRRGTPSRPAADHSGGRSRQQRRATADSGTEELGILGLPARRQRGRRHARGSRRSNDSSGMVGEIPAGPVPAGMRRRSEVGSVLESEQSDAEDADAASTAQA